MNFDQGYTNWLERKADTLLNQKQWWKSYALAVTIAFIVSLVI